jgi:hypothetical protein
MKHLLTLLCLMAVIGAGVSNAHAQQTPTNTKCNDESALSWDINVEPDMASYNVYASNNPLDVTADNSALILMSIPHPAAGVTVVHPLNSQLAEGDKYFRVTSKDNSGNESSMSLEAGCNYNLIPATPGNIQIILKLAVPPTS